MKRLLLIVLLLLVVVVGNVGATSLNFQYESDLQSVRQVIPQATNTWGFDGTFGKCYLTSTNTYSNGTAITVLRNPYAMTYSAGTIIAPSGYFVDIKLYDANYNILQSGYGIIGNGGTAGERYEMKMVGMTPKYYRNGDLLGTGIAISQNPSYVGWGYWGSHAASTSLDNLVWGSSTDDHHAISAIPPNWSIVRDILNTDAVGVYAENPADKSFVLKNSSSFDIVVDTDSLDAITSENLYITNAEGTIVNTTVINSSYPHHTINYNVSKFLAEAGYRYGRYGVHFEGSSEYDYFFVLGTGATITYDRDAYSRQDIATVTYNIEGDYWDTQTYEYRIDFISATTWETVDTNPISTSTGSVTYQFTDDDVPGTYYAILVAKYRSSGTDAWMNLDWADLDAFATFYGYVMNETGSVLSGANVSVTQGDIHDSEITIADGNYTVTGFYEGNLVRFNVTASGYAHENMSMIPLAAKRIQRNITLNSTTPTVTGLGIGGVARDGIFNDTTRIITQGYGRPLSGATVYLWNFSNSQGYTKTTNIAGWYICDDGSSCALVPGRIYDVQGRLAGYNNSQNYTVVTS